MLDMTSRTADRSPYGAPAVEPFAAQRPALAAFIARRKDADGAIGLILRAAGRADRRNGLSVAAEIDRLEAAHPDRQWLADLARIISAGRFTPTPDAVSSLARLAMRADRSAGYPLFGVLCFLARFADAATIRALLPLLRRTGRRDAALLAGIGIEAPVDVELAGPLLHSAFDRRWGGAPLATALKVIEAVGPPATALSIAEGLMDHLPPDHEGRNAVLAFIERLCGRRRAVAFALDHSDRRACGWSALYAAEAALEGGNVGMAGRLLAKVDLDQSEARRRARIVEIRIGLRLATDRLRFATTAGRRAAASALADALRDATIALPSPRWWPSAAVLIDHAMEAADLQAFDDLVALDVINAETAGPVAEHLLGPSARGEDEPDPEALAGKLVAAAREHRRLGRPEAAAMLFHVAGLIRPLAEVVRLEAAYVALLLGRLEQALAIASPLSRIYAAEIGAMPWPADRHGLPWPYAPMPYEAALPAGERWPRISVVVPSFNQVKYVRECLQSLVLQNYPNLEIIVFDAVSTDGTIAVLEEFRDQVASLIIEKDKGQSDAINKGLSRATGDLLHWLNTDDMLAPGACHAIALAWLRSKADIIAGACIEFSDHQMRLLNLPSAEAEDFREVELCKQFDRWLQGNFFYQPEVFFSKRIWDLTGGRLDPTHHLAMDFDLWLRSARADARYERIHWPIAFFRKHAEQKTSQLEDTIDEQAEIIAQCVPQVPAPARAAEIEARLARARSGRPRVAVVSKRYGKIFSDAVEQDLSADLADLGSVSLFKDPKAFDPAAFDAIVHLCHVQADHKDIAGYRAAGFAGAVGVWFWDNHHTYFENRRTAETADILLPGHSFCGTYLANPHARLAGPVPLCVTQWGRGEARELFARFGHGKRSDQLSGGFVDYAMSVKRNRLVVELLDAGISDALLLIKETDLSPYFGMSRAERFESWCSYKTSLCLPVRRDLSQRFFDAWLTGQVVVVPDEIDDLFTAIPAEIRARHMVTFRKWTPEAVAAAQAEAVALFDAGGAEGVAERHALAASQHMFADRIRTILEHW